MIHSAGPIPYPKKRMLLLSLVVMLSLLSWQLLLANVQVPVFESSLYFPVQAQVPALELTLLGAVNEQMQFAEAGQFTEASCHGSGFSFSLSPEATAYALGVNFSLPMSTRAEPAGSYSLVPGFGGMTLYLPASAQNPSARVFEAQTGWLQVSGNQGSFEAHFRDSSGASLLASGHWRCP